MLIPPSLGAARSKARAELLEGSLSGELGLDVRVRVPRDYGELQSEVLSGAVELAWAPSAVCAQLDDARALLRAVRSGHGVYHSAIVVRADAALSVKTLAGRRAAWVDPLSAGGYLLPVSWLRAQGVDPNLVLDSQVFLGSHRAVVDAVLEGKADLCAVSAPTRDEPTLRRALEFYAGAAARELVVLGVSEPAPTDAIVITTKVSPDVADRITKKLLPPQGRGRTPSFLLTAMEAERLERASLDEYRAVRALLWSRRADRATSRPRGT